MLCCFCGKEINEGKLRKLDGYIGHAECIDKRLARRERLGLNDKSMRVQVVTNTNYTGRVIKKSINNA